tara:strand:+ start:430 stop:1284 length:855 start_codon:yes stop_codon:yes gene_type:complete
MTKPINYHPYRLGNEHAEVKFGHIISPAQFGYYVRTGDDGGRHYFRMRSNGDVRQGQKGSTNFHSPGSFTIDCGQDIRGAKTEDGGKIVNPPAYNLLAQNGDVNIAAPHGTIRLSAQNIELYATANDGRNGIIKLDASEKVNIKAPNVDLNSTSMLNLFSEGQVNAVGKSIMNVYGGLMDFADGATATLGSKTVDKAAAKSGKLSSAFEDSIRDVELSLEATANELKKSKVPAKLKQIAESPEVAGLTSQMEGMVGDMEGLKNEFEKQTEELSKKLGGFFKDNL